MASARHGGINVTPLVDVVLVLLIIFLVSMPIALRDLALDVPGPAPNPGTPAYDQVLVEVAGDGLDGAGHILNVSIDGAEIPRAELAPKLHDRLALRQAGDKVVFVDFADHTRYADAVAVMDVARGAGATTVGVKLR